MISKKQIVKVAEGFAEEGFLCSESVLLAFSKLLGIKNPIIPKIATGFGAGIGTHGEVCGALAGGVMGLGLKLGRNHPSQTSKSESPYEYSQTLVNLFVKRVKYIRCRDLLGLDISGEEGLQTYEEQNLWDTKCRKLIRIATELAYDVLEAKLGDFNP